MSNFNSIAKRVGGFMRRNATYLLIVLCIASVATVIALAVTGNFGETLTPAIIEPGKPVINEPEEPVIDKPEEPIVDPLTFACPVNGTVSLAYIIDDLVWNQTLAQAETHEGVDFISEDLKVCAVAAGTVTEVGKDLLDGNYVIVSHAEGYASRYYSLDDSLSVKKGDTLIEGQLIGTMSSSMATESLDGIHLHFEMSKNNVDINPLEVLILEEK